ncbi:hypothetical protein TNCV_4578871 [Trichonephila clavipes]|nr:hypothetical protein TNCV_4578871 [Trichonephila clavipes]
MSVQKFLKLEEALDLLNSLDSDKSDIEISVLPAIIAALADITGLTDEEGDDNKVNTTDYHSNICERDYWSGAENLELITQVENDMPRNRFQKLKSYLHFVDDGTVNRYVQDRSFKGFRLPTCAREVKVSDRGLSYHELDPSTTKDTPCRGAMHVKSVESSDVLPLVWCGS